MSKKTKFLPLGANFQAVWSRFCRASRLGEAGFFVHFDSPVFPRGVEIKCRLCKLHKEWRGRDIFSRKSVSKRRGKAKCQKRRNRDVKKDVKPDRWEPYGGAVSSYYNIAIWCGEVYRESANSQSLENHDIGIFSIWKINTFRIPWACSRLLTVRDGCGEECFTAIAVYTEPKGSQWLGH